MQAVKASNGCQAIRTLLKSTQMQHPIQLAIPQPCQAVWADMKPQEAGRHCAQCRKTVVDFTGMSDRQLWKALKTAPAGLCGRFTASQLGRDLLPPPKPVGGLRQWVAGLMVVGILQAGEVSGRGPWKLGTLIEQKVGASKPASDSSPVSEEFGDSTLRTLNGRLIDSVTGKPLEGASVFVPNTRLGTVTNHQGQFRLQIPQLLIEKSITLSLAFVGYANKNVTLDSKKLGQELEWSMSPGGSELMGDVVIVTGTPRVNRKKPAEKPKQATTNRCSDAKQRSNLNN